MKYSDFKSLKDVCNEFDDLILEYDNFVKEEKITINKILLDNILEDFRTPLSFINETAICERLVSPIINIVTKKNNLTMWSHTQFNVKGKYKDQEKELTGEPDYLFAKVDRDKESFLNPVVCLGEAKQEKYHEGWGQVASEMMAAQILNKNPKIPIFGILTTGEVWKFAILIKNTLTINSDSISFPSEKEKVFNTLNWLFCEARKNIDKLIKGK